MDATVDEYADGGPEYDRTVTRSDERATHQLTRRRGVLELPHRLVTDGVTPPCIPGGDAMALAPLRQRFRQAVPGLASGERDAGRMVGDALPGGFVEV